MLIVYSITNSYYILCEVLRKEANGILIPLKRVVPKFLKSIKNFQRLMCRISWNKTDRMVKCSEYGEYIVYQLSEINEYVYIATCSISWNKTDRCSEYGEYTAKSVLLF